MLRMGKWGIATTRLARLAPRIIRTRIGDNYYDRANSGQNITNQLCPRHASMQISYMLVYYIRNLFLYYSQCCDYEFMADSDDVLCASATHKLFKW